MKNVYEVLRQKEQDLERIGKEVEALRVVAPLLHPEDEQGKAPGPAQESVKDLAPVKTGITAVLAPKTATQAPTQASGWNDTAKRWP